MPLNRRPSIEGRLAWLRERLRERTCKFWGSLLPCNFAVAAAGWHQRRYRHCAFSDATSLLSLLAMDSRASASRSLAVSMSETLLPKSRTHPWSRMHIAIGACRGRCLDGRAICSADGVDGAKSRADGHGGNGG